jgi:hypothetical protein
MPTAIPERKKLRRRSRTGLLSYASPFATTGVGSIRTDSNGEGTDTGASKECASRPIVSAPGFGFGAERHSAPRSSCVCRAGLLSSRVVVRTRRRDGPLSQPGFVTIPKSGRKKFQRLVIRPRFLSAKVMLAVHFRRTGKTGDAGCHDYFTDFQMGESGSVCYCCGQRWP